MFPAKYIVHTKTMQFFLKVLIFIIPSHRSNCVKDSASLRVTLNPAHGRISTELSAAMNLLKYTMNPEKIHH